MNHEVTKPVTTLLKKADTVGELVEQLLQFNQDTPFAPHQRLMHMKVKDKECIIVVEVNDIP